MTRRCDCGIALEHDGDTCSLCGPRIPDRTILLIAGHLLRVGAAPDAAFETASQIAYDLDARGLLAEPACRYCGKPGGDHVWCAIQDQRITELDALEDERTGR